MRMLLAVLVLGGLAAEARAAAPARRSAVLIVADDLGLTLGCYGDPVARTPHIDALARQGVRFTDAFATVSSCSASRAVIYTGLFTHTNGQFGHAHPPAELHTHAFVKSLPGALKDAGYRTGIIGKVHVLPPAVYPFDFHPGPDDPGGGHPRDVDALGKQASEFMASAGETPFLLVVGFHDPHRSAQGFGNEGAHGRSDARFDPQAMRVPFFLPDQPEVRAELAEYYEAVSRLDRGVGEILEALDRSGRRSETLVIFLSDNGMPFPGAKTTLYEPGIHLPLIIASPEVKPGGTVNHAVVSWVDITPTILDWAGAKTPYPLPGRSLLPILAEENPQGRDQVFGSFVFHEITNYYPMRMVRTRKYKYIRNLAYPLPFPFASDLWGSKTWQGSLHRGDAMLGARPVGAYLHRPREELYDLEADPQELHNLAGAAAHGAVLADLRARVKQWQKDTKDPWIVKDVHE